MKEDILPGVGDDERTLSYPMLKELPLDFQCCSLKLCVRIASSFTIRAASSLPANETNHCPYKFHLLINAYSFMGKFQHRNKSDGKLDSKAIDFTNIRSVHKHSNINYHDRNSICETTFFINQSSKNLNRCFPKLNLSIKNCDFSGFFFESTLNPHQKHIRPFRLQWKILYKLSEFLHRVIPKC